MEDNVKSFIDKIQELKETKIKVPVVSTGKSIDSTPLSFKQQKDLIGTIADGALGSLRFQKFINEIITTNTGNQDLKVVDKLGIILKLRIEAIGKTSKLDEDKIDLEEILTKVKALKFENTKTIDDVVNVVLEIPTITQESKIIQSAIESVKKEGEGELGKNIGNIYTFEIVKYIKSIKFGEDELKFQELPVKDRFKVVDNLPITVNQEIIKFIQEIKKKENEALTVSVNDEEKTIDIDVSFFDS